MDYWIKIFKFKYKEHKVIVIVHLDNDEEQGDVLKIRSMGNEFFFNETWATPNGNRDSAYELMANLTEVWAAKWFERMYINIVIGLNERNPL